MSEYLSPDELHTLTGYCRFTGQAAWLVRHKIPHLLDGRRVVVSRVHVQNKLEGRTMPSSGLNLGAIR